jgi:hypothetical protein
MTEEINGATFIAVYPFLDAARLVVGARFVYKNIQF